MMSFDTEFKLLTLNISQVSLPSLALELQWRIHRCLPRSFSVAQKVTTLTWWWLPQSNELLLWASRSSPGDSKIWVKGFWPAQSRACSHPHTAPRAATHWMEPLAATMGISVLISDPCWEIIFNLNQISSYYLQSGRSFAVIRWDGRHLPATRTPLSEKQLLISEELSSKH